jgi:hypothetical protein
MVLIIESVLGKLVWPIFWPASPFLPDGHLADPVTVLNC